jgi:hypothetical protein
VARLVALAFAASACGAGFVDTHPRVDAGVSTRGDAAVAGAGAGGDAADAAVAAPGADAAVAVAGDLARVVGPQTLASGMFVKGEANGGDTGSGGASLVREGDGSETAVFAADFQASQIPAGEVVLTARSAIGTGGIIAGDLDLGPLQSSMGAQRYTLPAADGGRRNLFVYCVTYGIDVAVAHLQ